MLQTVAFLNNLQTPADMIDYLHTSEPVLCKILRGEEREQLGLGSEGRVDVSAEWLRHHESLNRGLARLQHQHGLGRETKVKEKINFFTF